MKPVLRSLFTAVLIAAAVLCVTIGSLASKMPRVVGRPDVQETRTLSLPPAKSLRIQNDQGSIQVRSQDLDMINVQAIIKAYVRSGGDRQAAEAYVASLIRPQPEGDTLTLVTEPDDRPDTIDLRVDYVIEIPVGTDLDIDSANGNVWVSKECGRVAIQGRNTDIEVTEPKGAVSAQSTNGRIRVIDAPDGAAIKTVNGNIYAHMLGGVLQANTTNGAIVARVLDPSVEECTLNSQNGGITLVMQEDCSASVEALTDRGTVTCDFPMEGVPACNKRRHLKGVIGNGHTECRMETLNGNIWIAKGAL